MTAYLFPALTAALLAFVIVWLHWDWRTGKRRHEYRLAVITWRVRTLPYRLNSDLAGDAARARDMQLARLRAETFNHGLHSVKS